MRTLALSLIALAGAPALVRAAEAVPVPGSSTTYPARIPYEVGGKKTDMVLTGVALRKKFIVKVYAVASYLPAGTGAKSATDIAAADVSKWLYLVFERDVSGSDICDAFSTAIRNAHEADAFADEIAQMKAFMGALNAKRGDAVVLTHQPGKGLHINVNNTTSKEIAGAAFSRAVWDVYLGPKCINESIRDGLTSRLGAE